mmetsp:Transcript_102041/g.288137  ORF Transcript_102041/g.288137 Transcript_102041/m.288137 type:complete len:293 (+) Transcript_102041:467-1345(+)
MRAQRRHSDRRARDLDVVGEAEDLLQLPSDLHFLLGVTILLECVDLRDHVEGKLVRKYLVLGDLALFRESRKALHELVHALGARSARGLVSGHDHLFQPVLLVQRPERHGADGRGAVRVRDEPGLAVLRAVDLWDHQRDAVGVPEGGRVVDDHGVLGTALDLRRVLLRESSRHGHQHNLALLRRLHREALDGDVAELARAHGGSCGPLGEEPHLLGGEVAVLEALEHLLPHRTRAAYDADASDLGAGSHGDCNSSSLARGLGGCPTLAPAQGARCDEREASSSEGTRRHRRL